MGISYNSFYYFHFKTDEDAADFADATPDRVKASHFMTDAPVYTSICDDKDRQVLCQSDGYGTFDLTSFNRNGVIGCTVIVYECHTFDKAFAFNISVDEFNETVSSPYEDESYDRGIAMMSEESMPHYGEDCYENYDKMCDGWLEFISNKFRLEVEMLREEF